MPESTSRIKWDSLDIRNCITWISESSRKRATQSPSTKIQVGDYGVIDEETNEFERRGNIFKDREIVRRIPGLATDDLWKPQITSEEDKLVITHDGKMTDLGPNENAEVRLEFKGSGEFLVMYKPRTVDIPQPIDLAILRKIQKLNRMRLVTGVVTCSAYALFYWSPDSSRGGVSISLNRSSTDIPANSPVKQDWTWGVGVAEDGIYKDGYNPEGDHEYTPLFSLTPEMISDKSDNTEDAPGQTKLGLPIPPPSAGDGNEIFKSGVIGVAPWLSGKSKRPDKWKNRPAAPSDPAINGENHGEPIQMDNLSAPEPLSTTAINSSTRSGQAVGAADHSRYCDLDRMSEDDSNCCSFSCCCFK